MSHSDTSSQHLEEEEEAFIDLEDPNYEVLDENGQEGSASDDDAADNAMGEGDGGDGDAAAAAEIPETEVIAAPIIDLNEVPDVIPEVDDSSATFVAADRKPLHSIKISPRDSQIIAVAGESDEVYILRVADDASGELTPLTVLKGHTDTITKLAFSPNGEILASGSMDMTIKLWDCNTWQELHTLADLSGEIDVILWHPSSLALVGGATDAQAALWNAKKGTLAMYFVGHRQSVLCALWTPDMKKLVTGSADGTIIIFNPKTGEQEATIAKDLSPDLAGVTAMKFVSDDVLIAGCDDGTTHLVSVSKGKAVAHLVEVHDQSIESIDIAPTGAMYITSSCDCKVVVWNTLDHTVRLTVNVGESVIPACWVQQYVVAGCSDGVVRIWDGRSTSQTPVFTFAGHRRMILDFAVDIPRMRIATACDDGSLKIFSLSSKQKQ